MGRVMMTDTRVKATIPTLVSVMLGRTEVSVEIKAAYVLDRETSEEIKQLVMRIARLADGPDNG
jgi:hypothetical protein